MPDSNIFGFGRSISTRNTVCFLKWFTFVYLVPLISTLCMGVRITLTWLHWLHVYLETTIADYMPMHWLYSNRKQVLCSKSQRRFFLYNLFLILIWPKKIVVCVKTWNMIRTHPHILLWNLFQLLYMYTNMYLRLS